MSDGLSEDSFSPNAFPPSSPPPTNALDEDGGRALVEAWQASGLTGAAYCRQAGLRPQRLHYWRERLGYPIKVVGHGPRTQVASSSVVGGFVEMVVGGPPLSSASPSLSRRLSDGASPALWVQVGGATVPIEPGFDVALFQDVVHALRQMA